VIKFISGNLFKSHAEALVNTVNTVGVMGKGIALQFKERFPENFIEYKKACKSGELKTGKMFVTEVSRLEGPRWVINFPTKKHWKLGSSYSYIEEGLEDLIKVIEDKKISSIAIPPLGAGHGGLEWEKVKTLIIEKLSKLNIEIEIFAPSFQPESEIKENAVGLTKARALILALIDKYRILGFETTHLEIQKLAYFLQRMGQVDLKLQYKKFLYGPYAYNLQHLLSHLEGSYVMGNTRIMDTKPLDNIRLIDTKMSEVTTYIKSECTPIEKERLSEVYKLIEGFESPFGVELLSTVDWVINKDGISINDIDSVYGGVVKWNERKAQIIKKEHVRLAVARLQQFNKHLYKVN
jgi:O-acetyl-ADP-ribose deacetylase (regulator of RNase III)